MKKIWKFVPVINASLIGAMWAGCHFASNAEGRVDNMAWASDPDAMFALRDFASMFGHAGASHLGVNVFLLLLYGMVAEYLLGKVRYLAMVAGVMLSWLTITELFTDSFSIGASGWISAIPGVMLYGAARFVDKEHQESFGYMTIPVGFYAMSFILTMGDIVLINESTGVDHIGHLVGTGVGFAAVLAAFPFCFRMIKRSWKIAKADAQARRRQREFDKRIYGW